MVILLDVSNSSVIDAHKNYIHQNAKVHDPERKSLSLFQSNYIQLQSVELPITPLKYTVQAIPSKKKKNLKRERGKENEMEKRRRREKRWKRGGEEKRDGKRLCERKGKRENEMWKKRRKEGRENEREEEGEERR